MIRALAIGTLTAAFAAGAFAQAPPEKKGDGKELLEFQDNDTGKAGLGRGVKASKIQPTATQTALKFTLIDKNSGPIEGIVISLTGPDGKKYYTDASDSKGYAELLVPKGQTYQLVYLSLGRREIAAKVPVEDEPNQTIKLTLRYKNTEDPDTIIRTLHAKPTFVLKGVEFDTGKATIRRESYPRLDSVLEYMQHMPAATIEISGHTDNVGKPKNNKLLSQHRAEACRDYLVSKGIEAARIVAVGFGEEKPIAPNTTEEGRQRNRRIEAREL